jgi:hypothetical protein
MPNEEIIDENMIVEPVITIGFDRNGVMRLSSKGNPTDTVALLEQKKLEIVSGLNFHRPKKIVGVVGAIPPAPNGNGRRFN